MLEKKLKVPARPWVPSLRSDPGREASGLWAASSISARPRSSQSARQRLQRGRVAAVVDRADGLGPVGDPGLDVGRVDPEVLLPDDLGQHRGAAAVADRGGGGDEGDPGDDHLVPGPDPGGEVGEVKRRRAAARRDRVLDPEVGARTRSRRPRSAGPSSASPSAGSRRPPRPGPPRGARRRRGCARSHRGRSSSRLIQAAAAQPCPLGRFRRFAILSAGERQRPQAASRCSRSR